jgi:hypothetical protein
LTTTRPPTAVSGAARRGAILLEDPSGNPIELFEPTSPEAWLSPQR